jgi:uncharacterized protein YecT (DUF1311 family)
MRNFWTAVALVVTISGSACGREGPLYPTQDCNRANTQLDLDQCAQANFESADRELNRTYHAAMDAAGDEASRTQLRDSERAWLTFRDQECARQVGPREGGGSIWPMNLANCLEEKTARRIRELRRD